MARATSTSCCTSTTSAVSLSPSPRIATSARWPGAPSSPTTPSLCWSPSWKTSWAGTARAYAPSLQPTATPCTSGRRCVPTPSPSPPWIRRPRANPPPSEGASHERYLGPSESGSCRVATLQQTHGAPPRLLGHHGVLPGARPGGLHLGVAQVERTLTDRKSVV